MKSLAIESIHLAIERYSNRIDLVVRIREYELLLRIIINYSMYHCDTTVGLLLHCTNA